MLIVHRSNRVERLVESLGDVVAADPVGPFEKEPIIVQGRGMERWLSMELARRFGVWANPSFPFPRRFLLDLFARHLDAEPRQLGSFEPEALTWAIAARLPRLLERREFGALRLYLGAAEASAAPAEARLLALAGRIARTFDDYAVFRSEMIANWERGGGGDWQAILWRALIEDFGRNHVAARAGELAERLDAGGLELPGRFCLFGVSTLAPLYLDLFARLAAGGSNVHLFVLSPTDQYWAHIRDRRDAVRAAWLSDDGETASLEEVLEAEVGNRLLASLGRLGREFQAVLEGAADYVDGAGSVYEEPLDDGRPTALATVQSDMLALRYAGADGGVESLGGDGSIAVHSCHAPMREVQVLHDQLRAMFDADRSLRPRDVIVMTPDIDAYAPFVEAVFQDESRAIPFRIADRGPAETSDVFEAFAELLRILPGRMTSAEVIDFLRRDVVRRRFGFDEAEIEIARQWVDRTEIRWGIDAAHRAEHGHPGGDQNTWEFGLRRMFLGFAVGAGDGDDDRYPYAPYDDIEGGNGAALGRLAELCRRLFAAARRVRGPLPIAGWPDEIDRLLADLFSQEGAAAFQVQALRAAARDVAERAGAAGYTGGVDIATIGEMLESELRLQSLAHGFLSGDVTFCELVPMRTIPFRVVCLIGMNDGAFPRVERRPDFDVLASRHRWGDRSLRDDDRYMFLEALLSARDRFYVSYVGQDAQSGTEVPPSVVVQELLDVLDDTFGGPGSGVPIVRHPMQAFSPRYFAPDGEDAAMRSFSRSAYRGAVALVGERVESPPFLTTSLPWQPDEVVALGDLVRFFERPTRAFMQKRMRLYLGNDAEILDTREPLDLDDLEQWSLGDEMLARVLVGRSCDFEVIARLGQLPVGSIGRPAHAAILNTVERIAATAIAGAAPLPVDVDLDLGVFRLGGALDDVRDAVRQRHQYSKIGNRKELSLWIEHLALCAMLPDADVESRLCGRKGARGAAMVRFGRVEDPLEALRDLAALYVEGMRDPLPLFDGASRVYAEKLRDTDHAAALYAANKRYEGDIEQWRDAYLVQMYGTGSPFADEAFAERAAQVARAVYEPFLGARREEEL